MGRRGIVGAEVDELTWRVLVSVAPGHACDKDKAGLERTAQIRPLHRLRYPPARGSSKCSEHLEMSLVEEHGMRLRE
jgi:hypothetical protein